jgi:uncharacterized protein YlxP (DUF503 family)
VVVGVVTWDLHLDGCASLKDKRRIVKSLKDRLRQRFNVSVAETDSHELWQRAELSCCVVATDRQRAQEVLGAVDRFVAGDPLARIIDSTTSYL